MIENDEINKSDSGKIIIKLVLSLKYQKFDYF